MKKYIIIIGEENEATSRKVQEELFKAGFKWADGDLTPCKIKGAFIYVNYRRNGSIAYSTIPKNMKTDIASGDYTVLFPSDIYGKAHLLDGATKPVEELTMAQVCKELGRDVKIKKG